MADRKVLVVDDSEDVQDLVAVWLMDEPVQICPLTDGAECQRAVRELAPDLILLDVDLPGLDGFEVCRRLKRDPATRDVPVVFLTGNSSTDQKLCGLELGAVDYITKPFDPGELRARVRASLRTRQAEEERDRYFTMSLDMLATVGFDGLLRRVNPSFERTLGFTAAELLGQPLLDIVHPDDRERMAAESRRLHQGTDSKDFEVRCRCKDGSVRWVSWNATALPGQQTVYATGRDVTEQKRAAELERERRGLKNAVAAMEHVLLVVAHELRTPLAGIRAISEFLLMPESRQGVECDGFIKSLNDEAVRMSDTVENLVEAARLSSGRSQWTWSRFDLAGVVESALEGVRPQVDAGKAALTFAADPAGRPVLLSGDEGAVRRLVANLAGNARKHTAAGTIAVAARRESDAAGEWVVLEVADTGSGIAPELMVRLGEAFALNAGVVGAQHVAGTGLGLAICKGIAAAHGGAIVIHSVPGQGTTVTARLRADLPGPVTASPGAGGRKAECADADVVIRQAVRRAS